MHQSWNNSWSWGNWTLMMIGMAAFWALVVWAIVMLVRPRDRPSGDGRGHSNGASEPHDGPATPS